MIPKHSQNLDGSAFGSQHAATSPNTSAQSPQGDAEGTHLCHSISSPPNRLGPAGLRCRKPQGGRSELQTEGSTGRKIYPTEFVFGFWCYLVRNFEVLPTPDLEPRIVETQFKEEIAFNGEQPASHCRGPERGRQRNSFCQGDTLTLGDSIN